MDSMESLDCTYTIDVKGTLGTLSTRGRGRGRPRSDDVFKSLDAVVSERGIINPLKNEKQRMRDEDLPITGKNSRFPKENDSTMDTVDCKPFSSNYNAINFNDSLSTLSTRGRGRGRGRPHSDDVFKSLDSIVSERGIVKPPKTYERQRDESQIITTGKSVRFSNDGSVELRPRGSHQLDPMENSLDAIISDRRIDEPGINGVGRNIKRTRNQDEDMDCHVEGKRTRRPKSFVLNPYRAVSYLREKGMIVNLKIGKKVADTKEDEDPIRKWRCVVECGSLQGMADSARKTIAREMACDQFMKKLKTEYPDGKIPRYEIPDELYLDPKVCGSVKTLCEEIGRNLLTEFRIDEKMFESNGCQPNFECIYYVGDEKFIGRSTDRALAEVMAASEAYKSVALDEFPRTKYFVDKECDKTVEYCFTESEVYQTVEVNELHKGFSRDKLTAASEDLEEA